LSRIYKALVPLVTAGAALLSQWLATGHFNFSAEFVTAVFGVVTALFVYAVPNIYNDPGFARVHKAFVPVATGAVALIVQWSTTGHFNLSQEYVTVAVTALTALFVYLVPNIGTILNRP
jgi:hypothetical protein